MMPTATTRQSSTTTEPEYSTDNRLLNLIFSRISHPPVAFEIELPDHRCYLFGEGCPEFRFIVKNSMGLKALASLDEGIVANAYINGSFDVQGDLIKIYDLREFLSDKHLFSWLWRFLKPIIIGQVSLNKSAISHHYERDPSFYLSFLDEKTRCYTQANFKDKDEPIELAVRRKFDFCIEQCELSAGSNVLEVGPGWGAFSEYAGKKGIQIDAITISEQSLEYMNRLSNELELPVSTQFADILSYNSDKKYDAIVLMGIMEHLPDYRRVLKQFSSLLKPGGHVYLDASAYTVKYEHSSFIYQHIYPGNHSFFVLHDFLKAVADTPFQMRGVWDDRHSYYLSFKHWAERFDQNIDFIVNKFGEKDYRRFRLYLWGSAHCFLRNTLQCYRVVLKNA
ncbi:MAG TPA: methyltransferase domain-containing protein [Acidiferrobacteraceae bacterium]|nr:methyltransferase domain-containing protein [Acidiferrobacteraceae bacterium]